MSVNTLSYNYCVVNFQTEKSRLLCLTIRISSVMKFFSFIFAIHTIFSLIMPNFCHSYIMFIRIINVKISLEYAGFWPNLENSKLHNPPDNTDHISLPSNTFPWNHNPDSWSLKKLIAAHHMFSRIANPEFQFSRVFLPMTTILVCAVKNIGIPDWKSAKHVVMLN